MCCLDVDCFGDCLDVGTGACVITVEVVDSCSLDCSFGLVTALNSLVGLEDT